MSRERADRVAAWATGSGMGFLALMVTWLIGNRLAGLVWETPVGPIVAIVAAIVVGIVTALVAGRKLSHRSVRRDDGSAGRSI